LEVIIHYDNSNSKNGNSNNSNNDEEVIVGCFHLVFIGYYNLHDTDYQLQKFFVQLVHFRLCNSINS